MIPTKIISRSAIKACVVDRNGIPHYYPAYICDDGKRHTLRSIYRLTDVRPQTVCKRIDLYGLTSHLVLKPGRISMSESLANIVIEEPPTPEWKRSDCRRHGINCANYSDCQAQRCGLAGYPEWQHRDNTDECYTEPAQEMVLRGMDTTRFASWGF